MGLSKICGGLCRWTQSHRRSFAGATLEMKSDITDSCAHMMLQLHDIYDPKKVNLKIQVVSGTPIGAVAAESKRSQASWVVLDKQLKNEEKRCMDELQCNIVVMKHSQPKILRLNLVGFPKAEPETACSLPLELEDISKQRAKSGSGPLSYVGGRAVTPTSSPDLGTPFTIDAGTSSVSSSDPGTSPFFFSETDVRSMKTELIDMEENPHQNMSSSGLDSENFSPQRCLEFQQWSVPKQVKKSLQQSIYKAHIYTAKELVPNSLKLIEKP